MVTRRGPVVFRPKGSLIFHYRFRLDAKRTQRTTRETKQGLAQQVADEAWEAAKLRARGEEPEPRMGELVSLWVTAHALSCSRAHVENVERWGQLHLGQLAKLRPSELTTALVEDERQRFLQAGHAKSTADQWLVYLRLACRWAIRRGMLRAIRWDVKKLKPKQKPAQRLPAASVAQWLDEVDAWSNHEPAISLAVRLMVGLGLRLTEATAARWEWLDWERETYTPGDTKGKEAWARPVPPWVLDLLRPTAKVCGPMIPTREGRLVTPGRIQRVMNLACEGCDIPRLTPHKLRHTYATWLSEEGVPIQDIQAMLGHKDFQTTMRYLGVDLSRVRSAQGRLAERLKVRGRESGAGRLGKAG